MIDQRSAELGDDTTMSLHFHDKDLTPNVFNKLQSPECANNLLTIPNGHNQRLLQLSSQVRVETSD